MNVFTTDGIITTVPNVSLIEKTQTPVCSFMLKEEKQLKNKKRELKGTKERFHKIVCYGPLAHEVEEKYKAGQRKLFVTGEIDHKEHKKPGERKIYPECTAHELTWLDSK